MYIVKSPRFGVVGTEFVPTAKSNIAALIWGSFIEEVTNEPTDEVSAPAPKKGAKNKRATHKEYTNGRINIPQQSRRFRQRNFAHQSMYSRDFPSPFRQFGKYDVRPNKQVVPSGFGQ